MNEEIEEYVQTSMFTKLNNSTYTYKSSNLIMSSYDLSLTEQRIIALGCKKIKPIYVEKKVSPKDLENITTAMKFTDIEISVSEYKKEFKIKGNGIYDILEQFSNSLYEKSINYFDDLNRMVKKRWIEECVFDRPNGKIIMTFNIKMIPDLLILKGRYVPLCIGLLSENVRSKHAFRIYEILKNNAYNRKWKVSSEEFKFLLRITDKYQRFVDLKTKVIIPCLQAINSYSDISVEVQYVKMGKKGKLLEFYISPKERTETLTFENNDFKNSIPSSFEELSKALQPMGIDLTSTQAEQLIDTALEVTQNKYKDKSVVDYILEKVEVLKSYVINNKVDNVMGYLLEAIRKDWTTISVEKSNKSASGFSNFDGRQYTEQQYIDLEEKLLGWK